MTLVGFAWNCGDEGKMMGTFCLGRADFGCFLDLQAGPTPMCLSNGFAKLQVLLFTHGSALLGCTCSCWVSPSVQTHVLISGSVLVLHLGFTCVISMHVSMSALRQEVAAELGYSKIGLRAMAERVLGAQMPKSNAVCSPLMITS